MAVASRAPALDQRPTATRFDSPVAAVRAALDGGDPAVVVAFGEWHQTRATAAVPSALRRFTQQILPTFAARFSHLIVETWVTSGRCGEVERAVTDDVLKTTERPAETENEIETLLRAALAARVAPRILSITCADYRAMRPAGQPVDYDRTLRITTQALQDAILAALGDRRRAGARQVAAKDAAKDPTADSGRTLVGVYGGALHNDLYPAPGLGAYSFAPKVLAATLGRVLEIDLVVPEFASATSATSAMMRGEVWWNTYTRARRPGATVMVRRSPRSFVIVFPPVAEAHSSAR